MSSATPFTPPKKKPSILWWIGGAFLVLVLLFIFQLFGPSPRIIISPQTTYIAEPLGSDGLPNYERYILERCREGVTPQNNAAALLWPAVWPGDLDPKHFATVAAELGLDAIPSRADAVVPVYRYIADRVNSQRPPPEDAKLGEGLTESEADFINDRISSRPWMTSDYPWLAKWVDDSQKPLDKMVEASRRRRCYYPSPTLLDQQRDAVVAILLPGIQSVRECGRALVARAMWHVGEHRPAEAWQDLLAIHRIGRLVTQGPTLIEQLVGIAIDGIACHGTVALLHEGQLTPEQARQVFQDVSTLPEFASFADSIDHMERLFFLDLVTQVQGDSYDADTYGLNPNEFGGLSLLQHVRINWNNVLVKGNKLYDRLAAAGRLPTFEARWTAIEQINQDLQLMTSGMGAKTVVASIVNPAARSEAVASVLLGLCTPALDAAYRAQDRANSQLALLRIAAALAVYRAEHGQYPQKLDDLVPSVFDALPVDLYHAKPFIYERIEGGYLLYTAGPNGQDDGGSNEQQSIFEGRDFNKSAGDQADTLRTKIPNGADDLSIRVPLPPLKPLPTETNPNQAEHR